MMLVNAKIVLSISRCSSRSIWVDVSLFFMVDLLVPDLFSGECCRDFEKNRRIAFSSRSFICGPLLFLL